MTGLVDTETVALDGLDETSITLDWGTETSEDGDWSAVVESDDDDDSVAIRVDVRTRTVTASTSRAGGSTSRSSEPTRSTEPGIARAGQAAVSRHLEAARQSTAYVGRSNASSSSAEVSRDSVSYRQTTGYATASASTSYTPRAAIALPLDDEEDAPVVAVTPSEVATDHDSITLETILTASTVDRLEPFYSRAGDVDRESTAFGAFRRIPRDGSSPVEVIPGEGLNPPFSTRAVVPESFSASSVGRGQSRVTFNLGLESPRARESLDRDVDPFTASSASVSVGALSTRSVTLTWDTDGEDEGEWLATVSTRSRGGYDSSDEALVSVTDAPWVFGFPTETLFLSRSQVGLPSRSSDGGAASVDVDLRLGSRQAEQLMAAGSRVEALAIREVPDGRNTVVDTLPGGELTVDVAAPAEAEFESGEYLLESWNIDLHSGPTQPYAASVTLRPR